MTQAPSLIGLFVAPLNRAGIEYMVTGGLAAVVYGHPRLTLDVDLVIRLSARQIIAFMALWAREEFYCPPLEVITEESARTEHGHLNVIHNESMMRADVYFAGTDELNAWALQHRTVRQVQGEAVQFAPIEYVIVSKLRYFQMGGSDRHLRDIARMMDISGPELDQRTLDDWIARLRLEAEWTVALAYKDRE
ncbi:MAG TPA: hypothetical protein VHE78_16920 [Gemmatimonadaceae bacterium]|nr:hypothetical protein [Gemmatimonadaceae bacterium]